MLRVAALVTELYADVVHVMEIGNRRSKVRMSRRFAAAASPDHSSGYGVAS
jgi:hypothetical protein